MRLVHLGKGACYLPARIPLNGLVRGTSRAYHLIDRWQVALKLPLLAPGSLVREGGRLFYAPGGAVFNSKGNEMPESKFTPGPYCVMGPVSENSDSKRVFAGTTYLGTVTNSDMDPEEIEANAELWADAPRLLEVLRQVLEYSDIKTSWLTIDEAEQAFDDANELLEKHGG
jgi:hypothetical protein